MSLALRLVLAVLLVLNGIGPAMAHAAPGSADRVVKAITTEAQAPCHGHSATLTTQHDDHRATEPATHRGHAGKDCCGSSGCACVHAMAIVLPTLRPTLPSFGHEAPAVISSSPHAAPALPIPIRPPIA